MYFSQFQRYHRPPLKRNFILFCFDLLFVCFTLNMVLYPYSTIIFLTRFLALTPLDIKALEHDFEGTASNQD